MELSVGQFVRWVGQSLVWSVCRLLGRYVIQSVGLLMSSVCCHSVSLSASWVVGSVNRSVGWFLGGSVGGWLFIYSFIHSFIHSVSQSVSQSVNQSISQSVNQSVVGQSVGQSVSRLHTSLTYLIGFMSLTLSLLVAHINII